MTQPNTPASSPAHSTARIAAVLPENMLERFRDRAAGYDAQNTFCAEDFDELVQGGYLKALVPEAQGGLG
ncbi:MAG TPA: acyl-CoA dehydrogenase, partial [Candidatus Nesterenkonia stercoripullorum]|nr:acyl-CoA dehydrogenase [Candidatus Nesterenkonia stercoripullorum]